MTTNSTHAGPLTSKWPGYLLLTGSTLTDLLITMGGLVCATASGKGCPDWPGCFGGIVPPPQVGAIIEYTHRVIAALTLPVLIGAVVVCWRNERWLGRASRLPAAALVLLLSVAMFGALAVLRGLSPVLAAIDVGSALLVVALMFTTAVIALARQARPAQPHELVYRGVLGWASLAALVAVYFVMVAGMLTAGRGSVTQCLGGPLFGSALRLAEGAGWLQDVRRLAAGAAALAVLAAVVQAWRTLPPSSAIVRAATVAGVLLLVDIVIGALMATMGFMLWLLVATVAVTSALWASLVVLVVLIGLPKLEANPG